MRMFEKHNWLFMFVARFPAAGDDKNIVELLSKVPHSDRRYAEDIGAWMVRASWVQYIKEACADLGLAITLEDA